MGRRKPITTIDDPRYVKAFRHPLRVRILALLQERKASPAELAQWLDASLGTVAYHVRTLHQLGLIDLVDETMVRGAVAHHYRAKRRPRISDEAWAAASPMAKQAAVAAALQTIDDYARASAAAGGFDRADAHLTRTNLRLDARGWKQVSRACKRLLGDLERIEQSAAKRIERDPHAEGITDAAVVMLLFEAVRLSGDVPKRAKRSTPRRPANTTSAEAAR